MAVQNIPLEAEGEGAEPRDRELGEPMLPPFGMILVQEWQEEDGGLSRRFVVLKPCPINFCDFEDGVPKKPQMYLSGVEYAEMNIYQDGRVSAKQKCTSIFRLMKPTSDAGLVDETGEVGARKGIVTRVATDDELRQLMKCLCKGYFSMIYYADNFMMSLLRATETSSLQTAEYERALRINADVLSEINTQK